MQPNPADLSRFKEQAVDLDAAVKEREDERAATEAKARAAAEEHVRKWNKAMRRTFKGIFPAPTRAAFMRAHMAKLDREEASA